MNQKTYIYTGKVFFYLTMEGEENITKKWDALVSLDKWRHFSTRLMVRRRVLENKKYYPFIFIFSPLQISFHFISLQRANCEIFL